MSRRLTLKKFGDVDINDPFFDSLKAGYAEFPIWFAKKANESAYVAEEADGTISGFLYLKRELGEINDVTPKLPNKTWIKIGTLKLNAKGTRLGERIIKKVFDHALHENADGIYVTVFEEHESLISLFQKYGFEEHGKKATANGTEIVLVRDLRSFSDDMIKDYPFINKKNKNFWLLAIKPHWHTQLLPDSKLFNEPVDIIKDVSHTNTIHKIYVARLPLTRMKKGDIVVFYRTSDKKGPAYYRSVATSVCTIEEVKRKKDFNDVKEFIDYARKNSVYSVDELTEFYQEWNRLYAAKMTYNAALGRRPIRGELLNDVQIPERPRWDLKRLTKSQFERILDIGEINENIIIN